MPGYELVGNEELKEISEIFSNGSILCRRGFDNIRNKCFKVEQFEKEFSSKFENRFALAVSSGTAALRVALASIGIKEGDEVITQSFTFVATVEAIIESKAIPICTEIDETLNMDLDDLKKKVTSKTKAVIVVHMLGVPSNIEKISKFCKEKNIYLIEDTAWGCGGKLKEKLLGTWGDISTFSFDFAKIITTGEGGMVLYKNLELFKNGMAWHDHGHDNNPNLPRWEDSRSSSGFNFRMSELQAAVGIAQLKKLDYIINSQRKNRDYILKSIDKIDGVQFRAMPDGSYDTADALIFSLKNKDLALLCREELLKINISTKILPEAYTWHFAETWIHMPELIRSHNFKLSNAFPISRELLSRCVSIPISVNMNIENFMKIKNILLKILK